MQNFSVKKFEYILLSLLSFIYIALLLGIVSMHYTALISIYDTSIYDAILQNNWKYWFEGSQTYQTVFSIFLQYIDMHYLHSRGIVPIVINISFVFLFAALIAMMVQNIFHAKENHLISIRAILIFGTVIILFSALQDSAMVWMFNQQLFAGYFSPLLSYYLLVKFSITKHNRYFYALMFSSMMIIIATPYYFSALFVLFLLGYLFKIGWLKNLLILILLLISYFLYANDIASSVGIFSLFNWDMATEMLLYILSYLGSLFVYVSFEPCIATSSVVGGLFIISTFIYFAYLASTRKVSEPLYYVVLAYLLFYILTAFGSIAEVDNRDIVIFKNSYMTPSLIAWSLISILYIHHFKHTEVAYRRVLTLFLTFITVLYFYQIFTYREYKKDISALKLAAVSLKLGFNDQRCLKNITRSVYVMKYSPTEEFKKEMSIFTVGDIKAQVVKNRVDLLSEKKPFDFNNEATKNLLAEKEAVLTSSNKALIGGLDKIIPVDKNKNITRILGWVYDSKEKKVPKWLMVLDETGNMIGYIITGESRYDVNRHYGNDAEGSGFIGYIRYSKTPSTLFMVDELGEKVFRVKYPKPESKQ